MKSVIKSDFYRHDECKTLLMSEIKKLGCKRWVKRYCRRMHMTRQDVFAFLRGVRS